MNISGQNSKKTKRIENICNSLRARADLQTKLTETANIEKGVLGAQNTVEKFTFSDHSELKVNMGQTACSEKTARCHSISSETGATSERSSKDESTTNNKDSRPFQCLECGRSLTKQTHLNRNRKIYHKQPQSHDHTTSTCRLDLRNYKSSDIGEKFISSENKAIITENRSSLIALQVKPSNCVRGIKTAAESYEKNRFVCSICQKTFKKNWCLKIHMHTHTGEKPYVCEVCNESFSQSNTLTRHVRTHTGEKPYKCEVCNSTFTQNSSLKKHKRIHTGEKPFKCDVCNSAFAQSSHLKKHKLIHTREKPFECDVCNAIFSHNSRLRRHKRTHERA